MEEFINSLNELIIRTGISPEYVNLTRTILLLVAVIIILYLIWFITKNILLRIIAKATAKTTTKWDDYLLKNKVFAAVANLPPLFILSILINPIFQEYPVTADMMHRIIEVLIVIVIIVIANRTLTAVLQVLSYSPSLRDKPLKSYIQLSKILISGILIIILLSVATQRNPIYFFTGLGAVSAILILTFKDTIMGFVGSIQLAANDMIRLGDWVSLDKYGADGSVIEINLATVKVQNWDKTITTIPTYAFVSESFKNWRGMVESGGRRIKRSIYIKIDSIKFCDPEMIKNFKDYHLISEFVEAKEADISQYNTTKKINKNALINGRQQTNIGLFRKYALHYLNQNINLNHEMTVMVRQLQPTAQGLPIEIYCFSRDKAWVNYEEIQSDIFDHLFAAVPFFDLEIFENPSGKDLRSLNITFPVPKADT